MQFLKADYLEESSSNQNPIAEVAKQMTEKERKMKIEYEKIRKLDAKLA